MCVCGWGGSGADIPALSSAELSELPGIFVLSGVSSLLLSPAFILAESESALRTLRISRDCVVLIAEASLVLKPRGNKLWLGSRTPKLLGLRAFGCAMLGIPNEVSRDCLAVFFMYLSWQVIP